MGHVKGINMGWNDSSYDAARKEMEEYEEALAKSRRKARPVKEWVKPVRQASGVRFGYWRIRHE